MTKIYELSELNIKDLSLKKKSDRLIYFHNAYSIPILFRTPALYCKNNLIKKETKYSIYELSVILKSIISDNTDICIKFFESIDETLVELGKVNKQNWPFDHSKKIKYKSLVGFDNEIKFKIINSKDFNTLVFDELGNIIPFNDYPIKLVKNIYVKLTIELVGIWFDNNVYSAYLRLHEIRIVNKKKLSKNEGDDYDYDYDYVLSESTE